MSRRSWFRERRRLRLDPSRAHETINQAYTVPLHDRRRRGRRGHPRGGPYGDRGSSTMETVLPVLLTATFVIVCAMLPNLAALHSLHDGAGVTAVWSLRMHWSWPGMGVGLAVSALAAAAWVVGIRIKEASGSRRVRIVRHEYGPLLASWMGLNHAGELSERELLTWNRAHEAWSPGQQQTLTLEQARNWADAGIGFPTALIALQHGINITQVTSLVQAVTPVMQAAGAWGPHGQRPRPRQIHDLFGEHLDETPPYRYPVLHRWLSFSLQEVRDAVQVELAQDPDSPRQAEMALYTLERRRNGRG
ncbi:hypothetical protein [Kineococcus rhizosphaerae]|uniref:Uncharacterized protein n=1 Tax=Kineococcus rhizosphaerae TaxID=559628 RepID=A0A2T0QKT6_9ACTN|nr:hypothetical protein [Kineococcus rhizosphaerae]PRY04921.1 hypothetical protein CLV37_1433 [Kineococcus rhizosphaerae]